MLTADFSGGLDLGKTIHIVASQSEIQMPDIKQLAEWLGMGKIAGPGFKDFSAKGPVEWDGASLVYQSAQVAIDGNAADGSLSVQFSGERPNVDGTLAFASFELAPYVPDARRESGIFALGAGWLLPTAIARQDAAQLIETVDADLRISVARITLKSTPIAKGAATLTVKNGRLNANLTEVELEQGGTGEGQIVVDLRGPIPRFDISGELRAFDAASAGNALLNRNVLSGSAILSCRMTATGKTARELLTSLDGRASLTVPDGTTLGLDLKALMAAPTASIGKGWGSVLGQTSAAQWLTVNVNAERGMLSTQAAALETDADGFTATGTVDLRERIVDITVSRIGKKKSTTGLPEREAVRIRGPLDGPEITATP